MRAQEIATLAIAGVAVIGSVSSVLLLAYRVGRLTGATEARIAHGETDRVNIWRQLGAIAAKLDRHIESHGR